MEEQRAGNQTGPLRLAWQSARTDARDRKYRGMQVMLRQQRSRLITSERLGFLVRDISSRVPYSRARPGACPCYPGGHAVRGDRSRLMRMEWLRASDNFPAC